MVDGVDVLFRIAFAVLRTNEQELLENIEDSIAAEEATSEYDIFMDYALLGDAVEDGILSWIVVGIDSSANHTSQVQAAAHYYEGGGVDNGNSGFPGGPGGPGGSGVPSGTGAPAPTSSA